MNERPVQRMIVAARRLPTESEQGFAERLSEMVGLCEAAGGSVVDTVVQARNDVDAGLYLGKGKVLEMAERVLQEQLDLVVFDAELSPGQIRNLEARLNCRVLDRTQLILDIFAIRANTKEGRLQVEIAQLQYLLPRLTGRGVEMSRLGGGIGTRGPGETKLETDRRRIRERISHLRSELRQVRQTRQVQRSKRARSVPVVALVGYTNAGKSTLLQHWTRDKGTERSPRGHARLFDTLDPVARRVKAGAAADIVLLDTVGFVQNLPHLLVDAFRATLEEVLAADLIVHVVDAGSDPTSRLSTTYGVLEEIGVRDKPVITFYNKMDAVSLPPAPDLVAAVSVYGSARTGENLDRLYAEVDKWLELDTVSVVLTGPAHSERFWREVSSAGRVVTVEQDGSEQVHVTLEVERKLARRLGAWMAQPVDVVEARHPDTLID